MDGPTPNKQQLEDLWRERLNTAKLRLDFARQYMKEVQRDRNSGDIPGPDGNFAYQKALRAENTALAEYNRVLRVFTKLVVDGKIPDERASELV